MKRLKHQFKNNPTNKWTIIFTLNKSNYESVMRTKKMYLRYNKYSVYDDLNVNICYKCNRYDHSSKKCRNNALLFLC